MHKLIRPIAHLFHDFHNKKAVCSRRRFFHIHLRIIRQMELIERIEHKAHDHADDSGECHAGERNIAQRQRHARQAGNKDNRGQDHIAVLAVIHMVVNQDTQTGGADHAVQQERNAADDRTRNGLDKGCPAGQRTSR